MTVYLTAALQARIYLHVQASYPNESGGFLLGRVEDGHSIVTDTVPIQNVFASEEQYHRYAMTPQDWMRMEDEADTHGLVLVGYYHSHPDHPAVPSEYDRVHALPNFAYLIVSVRQGQAAENRAWQLTDDRSAFDEAALHIA